MHVGVHNELNFSNNHTVASLSAAFIEFRISLSTNGNGQAGWQTEHCNYRRVHANGQVFCILLAYILLAHSQ